MNRFTETMQNNNPKPLSYCSSLFNLTLSHSPVVVSTQGLILCIPWALSGEAALACTVIVSFLMVLILGGRFVLWALGVLGSRKQKIGDLESDPIGTQRHLRDHLIELARKVRNSSARPLMVGLISQTTARFANLKST